MVLWTQNSEIEHHHLVQSSKMQTILERLHQHTHSLPIHQKCWSYLDEKGEVTDSYSFKEIDNSTNALALHLLSSSELKRGDRVLLVFVPGLSMAVTLLACFKAGLIAVPVYPPDPTKLDRDLKHFSSITNDCQAKVALTHTTYSYAKQFCDFTNFFTWNKSTLWPSHLRWINIDGVLYANKNKESSFQYKCQLSDVAFLQYTSGSTSEPKGVTVTHANLAANVTLIHNNTPSGECSTNSVVWLPQYHDMGLIGNYLYSIYYHPIVGGKGGFCMSPITFIKDPVLWVLFLSKIEARIGAAPNFAYSLVARKFQEELKSKTNRITPDFSLSSIITLINGAEPISFNTCKEFYETFRPYGLREGVFYPTYGLAEHTLMVCGGPRSAVYVDKENLTHGTIKVLGTESMTDLSKKTQRVDPEVATVLVGCGMVDPLKNGVTVIIVDPQTKALLPDGQVGEVWVDSVCKTNGYWNKSEVNKEVFHAKLDSTSTDPSNPYNTLEFLRTGDLGFILNGEFFFCGRHKDMIIINGLNFYPSDIEKIADACHPALRVGRSAAFAVWSEEEQSDDIVLVVELKDNIAASVYDEIVKNIREAVSREHGVYLTLIQLLKTRSIEKTTSGKIARSWCKKAFLAGTLQVVHKSGFDIKPKTVYSVNAAKSCTIEKADILEIKQFLRDTILSFLDSKNLSEEANLLELGLNSQVVSEIAALISSKYDVSLRPSAILIYPTIDAIANRIAVLHDRRMKDDERENAETVDEHTNSALDTEIDDSEDTEAYHSNDDRFEAYIAGYGLSKPLPVSTATFAQKEREVRIALGQSEKIISDMESFIKSSKIVNRHCCHPIYLKDGDSPKNYPDAVGVLTENIFEHDINPPIWKRMSCFQDTCVKLCVDAASKALKQWGKDPLSISHILTTCTAGWEEPGIACAVIKELNLSEDIQKSELNFNGCFCGATCLRLARDLIRGGECTGVLIVACEVASTHINWNHTDSESLVAQSLFADGAAAMIVAREGLWKITKTGSSVIPNSSHLLRLRPPQREGETSFIMTLSKFVAPSLSKYFSTGHGVSILKKMYDPAAKRPALAIHPGGPRILEAISDVLCDLGWKERAFDSSYNTFAHNGNLGCAAMLFVLSERLSANDIKEDKLISMAFGPGVTVEWATYERASKKKSKNKKVFQAVKKVPTTMTALDLTFAIKAISKPSNLYFIVFQIILTLFCTIAAWHISSSSAYCSTR